jgi:2-iminobutanoate/2-iminopropanoate deaminase
VSKLVVNTSNAPEAVGPYSQAVAAGGFLFCSGQIPLNPAGEMVGGTIAEGTRRCLENLSAVLEAAGTSIANVIKVTAYLTDMADFSEFNDAYGEFFGDEPPARVTVGVASLPKGARVEVECIALGS